VNLLEKLFKVILQGQATYWLGLSLLILTLLLTVSLVFCYFFSKGIPKKQQRNTKETAKKYQRNSKGIPKKQQRNTKETAKKYQRRSESIP
jgi:predicted negative regulator of RcsB-dependent stress response